MHKGPAIGWYADPDKTNWERYWDGAAWTQARQSPGAEPTDAQAPAMSRTRDDMGAFQRFFVGLQAVFLVAVVALLVWVFTLQCDRGDRVCSAEQEGRAMALVFVTGLWIFVDAAILITRATAQLVRSIRH